MSDESKKKPSKPTVVTDIPIDATQPEILLAQENDFETKYEDLKKEVLYKQAELENTKKRLIREQEHAIRFSNEKIINEIFTVLADFDRAMTHGEKLKVSGLAPEVLTFFEGVELTRKEIFNLLARNGVELFGEKGEAFDPSRHEALSLIPSSDENVNKIVEVVKKGCLLRGRLLQPASVIVGKATHIKEDE